MSRTMSFLRLTASPLGQGTRYMLQGKPSASARVGFERAVTPQVVQKLGFANRPFSTQRPAKPTGQASRFRRSGATPAETPAETPVAPARQRVDEPASGVNKANVTEPAATPAASPTPEPPARPTHTRSQEPPQTHYEPPPPLKRVDTSSKEYKRALRKVTSLIVALPIAIVTSYYLWERRKLFLHLDHDTVTNMLWS